VPRSMVASLQKEYMLEIMPMVGWNVALAKLVV